MFLKAVTLKLIRGKMKKAGLITILIIGILLVVLGFVFFGGNNNESKTIKIGSFSKAIDYAPYLIAKNQGWFEEVANKYNFKVTYIEFQSLPPINEAFATNNLDIVFEAEAPAIVGKAAGNDIRIAKPSVNLIQQILVQKDSEIKKVFDLKDKKIAVLSGTSSHYGLIKILEADGISKNDVQILDMIPPDAKAAFETKQIDAWAVWPPWIEQEELAGKGVALGEGEAFVQSIMAIRGKFIDSNPELTHDLVNVIEKSKKWITDNPTEAKNIVANELNLPIEVIERAWSRHDFQASIGNTEKEDIQNKADFLYELKLIKNKVPVNDLLYDNDSSN